ncbi:hypothetical protein J2S74_005224 [Evansella vedderi]|uniref:Uncharacterized protein n=1 Tax=Evansella vedderi TaxID=38282 RepID=A0ABU0A2Q0_9BACI|nr:hypothetical protein [Evansella vedderi]MDQ0257762.1 hypothetical protein [Evansella vedderi]
MKKAVFANFVAFLKKLGEAEGGDSRGKSNILLLRRVIAGAAEDTAVSAQVRSEEAEALTAGATMATLCRCPQDVGCP